jgi:hypothetical protein
MTAARHVAGLVLAALPPGTMFLAQTWLVATGQTEAMLSLAKYAGLLGLVFFAFDGSSGLIPAMIRPRHSDAAIRSAYLVYRAGVAALLVAVLLLFWKIAPAETATLLPFLALALLLRFPLLDADLDKRGLQHWAMLAQNCWMLPLCLVAVLVGGISAKAAGQAALAGSSILALAHLLFSRSDRSLAQERFGPALMEITTIIGAQGIGQLYGRTVLFVLGASFTGPLPALIIYGKQAFNAAGLLATYLRRIELARNRASMGLSLMGQAAVALVAGILVALAAPRLGVPHGLTLTIIVWQCLEKLSATTIFAFQLDSRHRLALTGLVNICILGLTGLALARAHSSPLLFVAFETLGYGAVLFLWLQTNRAARAGVRP